MSARRAASQRSALVNSCVDIAAPCTAPPSQLMMIRTWVTVSSSLKALLAGCWQRWFKVAPLLTQRRAPFRASKVRESSVRQKDWLASHSGRTSTDGSPGLADGGSCHTHTVNSRPAHATGGSDFRDHSVRLRNNRRRCHGLRRCCNQQGEASNSYQPNHSTPPITVHPYL
jgi:hypothetical protein